MLLPSLRRPRSAIGACTTLFLTLLATACDHSPSGPGTNTATFTLELGGIHIAANGSTMIRHGDRDGDMAQSAVTLADFVALVQADIAAGHNPTLTASRPAPSAPRALDDGKFLAADVRLDEANSHSVIKLNVAAANLVTNATPPPDGFLKLLGVSLEAPPGRRHYETQAGESGARGRPRIRGHSAIGRSDGE